MRRLSYFAPTRPSEFIGYRATTRSLFHARKEEERRSEEDKTPEVEERKEDKESGREREREAELEGTFQEPQCAKIRLCADMVSPDKIRPCRRYKIFIEKIIARTYLD